jgi:hypothetical protein
MMYGGQHKCIQNFIGKPEMKRPLWGAGRRWKGNIKIYVKEMVQGALD